MQKSINYIITLGILTAALVFFLWQTFYTDAGYTDGDSITHYLIARNAIDHPILFLHHWGKPFFTTFAAPFAYFGFNGIQVFNVICGLISAFFSFKVARKLEIPFAPAAALFTLAAPVFYINIPTGLTEIFFGLVLVISVYLAITKQFIFASILVSFLPFARSEGFLLLPLFGLFFLYTRQYKAIPLLAFGTLVYSIIGFFAFGDFGWIFNQNPYHENPFYGHGHLLYFVDTIKTITGIPLIIVFMLGLIWILYTTYKQSLKNALTHNQAAEFLLIFGCFCLYFVAHTIFWWQGLFASLGMTRVIAAVIPVFAVGALRGLTLVTDLVSKKARWAGLAIAVIFAFIVLKTPFAIYGKEEILEPRLVTIKQACEWLKQNNTQPEQVYYSHPFTVICMDIDPYSGTSHELMYLPKDSFAQKIPTGNIVVWDSQFGPNESGKPLELLQDTSR
ncbi:MAG: hypothetical protein ACXWDO_07245, partial [Bacteroidia bacterium]